MQHTGTDALRRQTAPAVFTEAHDSEANHLGTAARHGSAAGQSRQSQCRADGGGGDGQRQRHADDDGHQNAHEEGLQLRRPHDGLSHSGGRLAHRRGDQRRKADTGQHRDDRRHQNVDLRLLADGLTHLGGEQRHEQHGKRAACAAHIVGGKAHGDQGEQHQRRRLQRTGDGHRHAGAYHGRTQPADGVVHRAVALTDGDDDGVQKPDVELLPDGVENRSHQQRAEQSLCHSAHGVDEIALCGENDVLTAQKRPYLFHASIPHLYVVGPWIRDLIIHYIRSSRRLSMCP